MGASRGELFRQVGIIREKIPRLDGIVEDAYVELEHRNRRPLVGEEGQPLHTSFRAAHFPGGVDEKRCGRKALYELMNIPGEDFQPRGIAVMEAGQDIERRIVRRLELTGRTLAGGVALDPAMDSPQLKVEDREHWTRGYIDSVLDLRDQGWNRPVPMDVKSKGEKVLFKLRKGEEGINANHRGQVMCYVHMCRRIHREMGWEAAGFEPAEGGILYHVSRSNPRDVYEAWIPWDQDYVDVGLARLKEWIGHFQAGSLPDRPKEWRWTEEPCKWCPFKKPCKQDIKEGITALVKSNTVVIAVARDSRYDAVKVVSKVNDAWR